MRVECDARRWTAHNVLWTHLNYVENYFRSDHNKTAPTIRKKRRIINSKARALWMIHLQYVLRLRRYELMNEPEFLAVRVMQHRFAVYFILNRGKIAPLQHILEQPHIL
ncbi:TPA: cytoplasmic protein [Salmonella enterica]